MYIPNDQAYSHLTGLQNKQTLQSVATVDSSLTATDGRHGDVGKNVTISEEAKRLNGSDSVYTLKTAGGDKRVDLDTYFAPNQQASADLLSLDSLLLPNSHNVAALQDHISKVFPDFLSKHNIPEAPSSIQYDGKGQIVLPADYPYADQLKQALDQEPAMAKELSTANALASHVAALKALEPFQDEYDKAQSKAEIDAVIDKYSHLLGDNRTYPDVELSFDKEGRVSVLADGKALV